MEKFIIEGGHKLSGSVKPGGSKNEALPVLAATLLTDEPITLRNVPRIRDVEVMIQVLQDLGGEVRAIRKKPESAGRAVAAFTCQCHIEVCAQHRINT